MNELNDSPDEDTPVPNNPRQETVGVPALEQNLVAADVTEPARETESPETTNVVDMFTNFALGVIPSQYRKWVAITIGGLIVGIPTVTQVYSWTSGSQESRIVQVLEKYLEKETSRMAPIGSLSNQEPAKSDADTEILVSAAEGLDEKVDPVVKGLADATVALSKGDYDTVIHLLPAKVESKFGKISDNHLAMIRRIQGMVRFKLHQWDSAKTAFEDRLAILPDSWLDKSLLGACYVNLQEYETAVELYDELLLPGKLERDEWYGFNLANAYNNRGISHQNLGAFEAASRDYDKAVGLIDRDELPEYQSLITKAVALNNVGTSLVAQAEDSWLSSGEFELSDANKALYQQAIDKYGKAIDVLLTKVETDLAATNRSDLAMLYGNRAVANSAIGESSSAATDFSKAVELRQTLVNEGKNELRPKLVFSLTNMALSYQDKGAWWDMAVTCARAIKVCDEGICLTNAGDFADDLKANLIYVHFLRGAAYDGLGEIEKSVKDYEQGVKLYRVDSALADELSSEEYQFALNNLAWIYSTSEVAALRNEVQAIVCAEEVCELNKEEPVWEYLDTLAAAYANSGDFEKALEIQQVAMDRLRELNQTQSNSHDAEGATLGAPTFTQAEFDDAMAELQSRLDLYLEDTPFRDTAGQLESDGESNVSPVEPPERNDEVPVPATGDDLIDTSQIQSIVVTV